MKKTNNDYSEKRTARLLEGYPIYGNGNRITFAGLAYEVLYEEERNVENAISVDWSPKTWNTYIGTLNTLIRNLPINKPMCNMRDEDIDNLLENILMQNGEKYSISTLQNIGYWFYRLYKIGVERGKYKNKMVFDDLYLSENTNSEKDKIRRMLKVRRSLSTSEELQFFNEIYNDPTNMTGEDVGLLIMFLCACRENEVCGLDYGDIRKMREYDAACLWIYETTEIGSSIRKAGGKTKNAVRILPVLDFLYDFLMKRRTYIQGLIDGGILILNSDKYKSVDDLPIVCIDNKYKKRSPTKYLLRRGRMIFNKLSFRNINLGVMNSIVKDGEFRSSYIEEKSPTTYLLRRNRGTSLYNVGFTVAEIQYYMGHNIDDEYKTRNHMTTEKTLYEIREKLKNLPINIMLQNGNGETVVIDRKYQANNMHHLCADIIKDKIDQVKIVIKVKEANDTSKVDISSNNNFSVRRELAKVDRAHSREIDINSFMEKAFCHISKQ